MCSSDLAALDAWGAGDELPGTAGRELPADAPGDVAAAVDALFGITLAG